MTQFSAGEIQNLRIKDIADLAAYTPNLEINTAFNTATLFIRGIGLKDYNANAVSAVAVWYDDVQMISTRAALFSLFDIESITIQRGPQGGLRSRNASAGLIEIHSAEPDGEWDTWGSFTRGNLDTYEFEGALGFPILPDVFDGTLSGRLAVTVGFRDGYLRNHCAAWTPSDHINPRTGLPFFDLTIASLRETYNQLDRSDGRVAGFFDEELTDPRPKEFVYFNGALYRELRDAELVDGTNFRYRHEKDAAGNLLFNPDGSPKVQEMAIQRTQFDMASDGICMLGGPGNILTPLGFRRASIREKRRKENRIDKFRRSEFTLTLSDFADLKPKLNSVEYWGARGMLRFQPTDTLDFLFTAHWGRDRSDAFRTQIVGAEATGIGTGPRGPEGSQRGRGFFEYIPVGFILNTGNVVSGLTWFQIPIGDEPEITAAFQYIIIDDSMDKLMKFTC